jgi:hypothetical protein
MVLFTFKNTLPDKDGSIGPNRPRPRATSSSSSSSRTRLPFLSSGASIPEEDEEEPDLRDLNNGLQALVEIFPNVRPDVFREMLGTFSPESRLHVIADQILKHEATWVKGRWRIASKASSSKILSEVFENESKGLENSKELLSSAEKFRSKAYKNAVRLALNEEFTNLSRNTIKGVLAEENYSYTNSRPILAALANEGWRFSFKALISWRKPTPNTHFMIIPAKPGGNLDFPRLKITQSIELNQELYETVLKPLMEKEARIKDEISFELATLLNEGEAKDSLSTFECECCYDDVAFEAIVVCSQGEHVFCFKCVQKTVSAALYAQAWSKSIDHDRCAVLCFASTSCTGCIPRELTKRAILQTRGGDKTWIKFEEKLAKDALQATGAKFHECPFCTYAESDDIYWPAGCLNYRFKGVDTVFSLILLPFTILLCIFGIGQYYLHSLVLPLPSLTPFYEKALESLARKRCLSSRFVCQNPECRRVSCRLCRVSWRDPHTCNEKEEISLRTAIEAARTAATKRVCPKCNLSFVKESGCNKMTCTCGYKMCYLCREGLGKTVDPNNPHADHDYSHFCSHFRAIPGRCLQCNKCDLYIEGNEEEIVRKAGLSAEKEWRAKRKAKVSVEGSEVNTTNGISKYIQEFVDYLVDTYMTC